MSREKSSTTDALLRELFSAGVYKRNQGRIARQVTFAVLALTFALGAWRMSIAMEGVYGAAVRWGVPLTVAVGGMWVSFRAVNLPRFADFLIAVEAEMTKVSWPDRTQLLRSSLVVILTIFSLAAVLFAYDIIWQFLLRQLGILG